MAARDPALVHSFWLLTQLPHCARAQDFVAELKRVSGLPPFLIKSQLSTCTRCR
jgi:hypothetical protein